MQNFHQPQPPLGNTQGGYLPNGVHHPHHGVAGSLHDPQAHHGRSFSLPAFNSTSSSHDSHLSQPQFPHDVPDARSTYSDLLRFSHALHQGVSAGQPLPTFAQKYLDMPLTTGSNQSEFGAQFPYPYPSATPSFNQATFIAPSQGSTQPAPALSTKRKEAPAARDSSTKRTRKSKRAASSSTTPSEPSTSTDTPAVIPPQSLRSIVRQKAGTMERSDSASDVWWAMISLPYEATSNDEVARKSGRNGPSESDRNVSPVRKKPSPQAAPRVACRYCSSWITWANKAGSSITSTIRDHLYEFHFTTADGADGPWKQDIIHHHLKGYDSEAIRGTSIAGSGDSALKTHAVGSRAQTGRPMSYPEGSFTLEGFIQRLIRWILVDDQSITVIETNELRDLLLYLHAGLEDHQIPKRSLLTKKIWQRFEVEYDAMIRDMQDALGRVSLTSDCWTDSFLRPFMAMTSHCSSMTDGCLGIKNRLIGFRYMPGSHTGENMATTFLNILTETRIKQKVGIITLDNAGNNNTMMEALESRLNAEGIPFDRIQNRGRCFPHVVNIAVQTALRMISSSAPQPDTLRDEEPVIVNTMHVQIAKAADAEYVQALRSDPVAKCRQLVANCRKSSQRREDFIATIKEGNANGDWTYPLPENQLLRDVDTRWSSTFLMIDRVLELNEAINKFLNKNKQVSISSSALTSAEVMVLDDIRHVLEIPHLAQHMLAGEKTPTLPNVLPTYEELIRALKELESSERYYYLRPAISAAVEKVENYLQHARSTKVYALAMVINPLCKFKDIEMSWSHQEIERAKEWLREAMLERRIAQRHANAKPASSPNQSTSNVAGFTPSARSSSSATLNVAVGLSKLRKHTASALARPSHRDLSSASSSQGSPTTLASSQPDVVSAANFSSAGGVPLDEQELEQQALEDDRAIVDSEIRRWCASGPIPENSPQRENFDLVRWWQFKGEEGDYPTLYRLVLDLLPMQASAVPCERVFSSSKHTSTDLRNQMHPVLMEVWQILKHLFKQQRLDFTGEWSTSDPVLLDAADPPEDYDSQRDGPIAATTPASEESLNRASELRDLFFSALLDTST